MHNNLININARLTPRAGIGLARLFGPRVCNPGRLLLFAFAVSLAASFCSWVGNMQT